MKYAALPFCLALAAPAYAQSHEGHTMPATGAAREPSGDHRSTDHPVTTPDASDEAPMEHGAMDHSQMDHSRTNHEAMPGMDNSAMPAMDHRTHSTSVDIPESPPPPEAFSGPAYAADEAVGAQIMESSRIEVMREVSGMPVAWFQAERLEYRARQGADGYLWDAQGFYGGDYDKIWFKSEGEGSSGEKPESAEVQALWSHAIGPWFDLQAGVRQDLAGPARTHLAIGVQGLAPYLFEVDAAAFLSNKGDVTARIEAELDQRVTQRLILQPRAEFNLSAQDIPETGTGAGLDRVEAGVRLRYEIAREFAPYIGVAQEWRVGDSARYARAAGEDPSVTNFVAGVRFWF